jgi:anaerobic selenocysteine-containing dehydrogenase
MGAGALSARIDGEEMTTTVDYRTCPLCEATCGLQIELDGRQVTKVKGDPDDVFSRGFICPKGASLGELHADPDRLSTPLVRRDGELLEASWDQAFEAIDAGLSPILGDGDRNAVGAYLGNPNAHTLDGAIHLRALLKGLGSRNIFSASSVDQLPKQLAVGMMFGAGLSVPIPDIDRSDYLLVLGANPLASNGSLLTAPDLRGRLRRLRERGGKLVVIDPRRSRTAEAADEHHFIRPGRDAHLLAAIGQTILSEGLAEPGRLEPLTNGLDEIAELLAPFSPEGVSAACGIEATDIRRIARELAAAPTAAVYGRIGTTTQQFGTLASWLVDVLNVITGNLDRPGGAMFPLAAAGQPSANGEPGHGRGVKFGRWFSRVRGLGESFGELPVACLSEEIETPGEGQIRAMITVAGNPVISTPNATRIRKALSSLEFMVSVDCYLNETTSLADVVLPVPSPLERSHYDLAFYQLSIRNVANFSSPTVALREGMLEEWSTLVRLLGVITGQGPNADIEAIDDFIALEAARRETVTAGSPAEGKDPQEVLFALGDRRGPERILDLLLRCGPYGAGLNGDGGRDAKVALSLEALERAPHGIDLGPMKPRLPEVLRTPSGRIELCPEPVTADLGRLAGTLAESSSNGGMVLIGRRHLRSNNSWLHNLPHLVRGPERCTMHVSPADADRLGLGDGATARVQSRAGSVEIPVEVTDAIMDGVVSIPHGWGHDAGDARMQVAAENSGVNSNLLADETLIDPLSGNAVLNGIPVTVNPA